MPLSVYRRPGLSIFGISIGVCAIAITAGCKREPSPSPAATAPSAAGMTALRLPTSGTTAAMKLQPLQGKSNQLTFEAPELSAVTLRIPLGITEPARVLVVFGAARGALDATCDNWFASAKGRFILCQTEPYLNGTLRARTDASEATLRTALRAMKRHFGGYVASTDLGLVGLGEAADVVVELVRKSPAFFTRIALVEGGFTQWTAVDSGRYSQVLAARALLVCRQAHCAPEASRVFATLRASGVPVKLLPDEGREASGVAKELQFPVDFATELAWLLVDVADSPSQSLPTH